MIRPRRASGGIPIAVAFLLALVASATLMAVLIFTLLGLHWVAVGLALGGLIWFVWLDTRR